MTVDLRFVAARVAEGDDAAFRQIVDHTRAPMYRLAARLVGDLAEAEDALQDAFVDAYRALRQGRYDGRSKVETWLYRIVTNACLDVLRRRRDAPVTPISADLPRDGGPRSASDSVSPTPREPRFDGLVTAEARLALRELSSMLGALPPDDRAALVLVAVEGLSAKEAGSALGCSEGAVEQRLVRARAALRAQRSKEEATFA